VVELGDWIAKICICRYGRLRQRNDPHASQSIRGINMSEQRFEESDILAGHLGVAVDEGKISGRAQNGVFQLAVRRTGQVHALN
jgi:hypothetical protein